MLANTYYILKFDFSEGIDSRTEETLLEGFSHVVKEGLVEFINKYDESKGEAVVKQKLAEARMQLKKYSCSMEMKEKSKTNLKRWAILFAGSKVVAVEEVR